MSTRYPAVLPDLDLPGRWSHAQVGRGGDIDAGTGYTIHRIEASSAPEAEGRVLAVVAYDFEDDLRGVVAAAAAVSPGVWEITLSYPAASR